MKRSLLLDRSLGFFVLMEKFRKFSRYCLLLACCSTIFTIVSCDFEGYHVILIVRLLLCVWFTFVRYGRVEKEEEPMWGV